MNNYKLIIQYDGSRYKGWQRLSEEESTIQDKIEQVLSKMLEKKTEINGCSRTDAGVHALGQVANFTTNQLFESENIKAYLNHYLPEDIKITEVSQVSENFHARYHSKGKSYLYRIWNKEYPNPFYRKYSMHVEHPLDIESMKAASRHFVGVHDFSAFSNAKSKKKSTEREIFHIDIQAKDGFIDIHFQGDGFLYNMVRWMVGALVEVGKGNLDGNQLPRILEEKERGKAGDLAHACGLFLENVIY